MSEVRFARIVRLLLLVAIGWAALLLHRAWPLAPDEVEFFRATHWVAEGKVPYRDFWEHHTPLQWIAFAPIARMAANGPGVEAIVAMRWAQAALWVGVFVLLHRMSKRVGGRGSLALLLLLVSTAFVSKAIEYRLDVPGNAAFVGAVALVISRDTRMRWIGFGALMSAAVLANMRLAPLVIVTAVIVAFRRSDESRWRWNPGAVWMLAGIAPVALGFLAYLRATGALAPFRDAMTGYNVVSSRLLQVNTLADALLLPLWTLDIGAIAMWSLAIAGCVIALRDFRRAGEAQLIALIFVASVVSVAAMKVQYDYHFQNAYLLMVPLVALALARLTRPLWLGVAAAAAAVALTVSVAQIAPSFGSELDYQDAVMERADALTSPGEAVLDGGGYALRREPAYRYWFLTTGVRFMAASRLIDAYDANDMAAHPPAAIIFDYRLAIYCESFPALSKYIATHYVPLYRNLWVPGMTVTVDRSMHGVAWTAPRSGRYDIWASEDLMRHPMIGDPLRFVRAVGPSAARLAIPLDRLRPLAPEELRWLVDGVPQPAGVRSLMLRRGSQVELMASAMRPARVLLVPHGIGAVYLAPADNFVF